MDSTTWISLGVFGLALFPIYFFGTQFNTTIVIVGGGSAGISTAYWLSKTNTIFNRKVIIVESQERLGGRIWRNHEFSSPISLGAAWIHGYEGNVMTSYADKYGCKYVATNMSSVNVFTQDGKKFSSHDYKQIYTKMQDVLNKGDELYFSGQMDHLEVNGRDRDRIDSDDYNKWKEKYKHDDNLDHMMFTIHDMFADYMNVFWPYPSDDEQQMLEFFWFSMFVQAQTTYLDHIYPFHHSYWGGKGADVFLLDGYMCIMEGMLADAKPHVLLQQPVQEIEMNSGKLQVFTEDHRIEADKVVITVPLHVLHDESIIGVEPEIPLTANMGETIKIGIEFERIFWDANTHFIGYVGDLLEGYGSGLHFELTNLAHPDHGGLPMFVLEAEGRLAYDLCGLSNPELKERIVEYFHQMYGPDLPDLIKVVPNCFHENPNYLGALTYINDSFHDPDSWEQTWRPEDGIHYAGEHTSRYHKQIVLGGYDSGRRVAGEIDPILRLYFRWYDYFFPTYLDFNETHVPEI